VPIVSVIIPVWNDAARLKLCLEALGAQTLPADDFEIIVVDNGSGDTSYEVACSFANATALRETAPGSYNARNLGLTIVRGQYVAFTDSDCLPDPEWLEHGLKLAQSDPRIGIVAGHIALFKNDESTPEACVDYESIFSFNQQARIGENVCTTANWLSPMSAIEEGGRFDGQLRSQGDFKLSRQIGSLGWRIVYCADCIVRHPARGSVAELTAKRRRVVGGKLSEHATWRKYFWVSRNCSVNCARKTLSLLRHPDLPWSRKRGVFGIVVRQWFSEQLEIIRLAAGGEPRR
jgi:glycosyltransferase involved in cell wall biosynthesis